MANACGQVWTQSSAPVTDKPILSAAPAAAEGLFTGHQREGARSGVYEACPERSRRAGARFYSADLGRFLQADSIIPSAGDPQSLNRYSYVVNNPIRYTDPSGNCIPEINCPRGLGGSAPSVRPALPQHAPPTEVQIIKAFQTVGVEDPYEPVVGPCWMKSCPPTTYLDFVRTARTAAIVLNRVGVNIDDLPWSTGQRVALLDAGIQSVKIDQFRHTPQFEEEAWLKSVAETFRNEKFLPVALAAVGPGGILKTFRSGLNAGLGQNPYHALDQAITRGARPSEILDAMHNPSNVRVGNNGVIYYTGRSVQIRIDANGGAVTVIRYRGPNAP